MKKFLIRFLLFIGLVILINAYLRNKLPYYWGNESYALKSKYLEGIKNRPNTIFIGSSATNYTIRPTLFDSLTNQNTLSFNLGSPGCLSPENLYLAENLINNSDKGHIDYLILEVTHGYVNRPESLIRPYFLDFENFYWSFNDILLRQVYEGTKRACLKELSNNFVKNLFALGVIRKRFFWTGNTSNSLNASIKVLGDKRDGFIFPLTKKYTHTKNIKLEQFMGVLEDELESNSRIKYGPQMNMRLLERFKKLQAASKAKGVDLMFFMYPNVPFETYLEIVPIMRSDSPLTFLNVSDPQCYPFLYDADYYVDMRHLSYKGSELFTRAMAEQFNLINDNRRAFN